MNRVRREFCLIGMMLLTLAVAPLVQLHAAEAKRPNFVIFFTDDLGYADVGCFGSKIPTPNFDRMARQGTKLTSFYAQNVCGVSRAAILTGCYPIRCGEPGNHKNAHTVLHPREVTIAEVLKSAGYATACVGKWHVAGNGNIRRNDDGTFVYGKIPKPAGSGPFLPELMPNAQGFDYFFGTPMHNGTRREPHPADVYVTQLIRNGKLIDPNVDLNTLTTRYTEEATDFIRAHRQEPFFLYLAHTMPHVALGMSDKFRGRSDRGLFGDAVMELDWSLGQVMDTLKELGLDENTLVIFTSDNGPWVEKHLAGKTPQDNYYGSAEPLRGWKMQTWEGGLREPGIIRWPGHVPAGRVSDQMVATLDLLPTLASLAGAKLPPDRTLDGVDQSDFFLGKKEQSGRDEIIYYGYTYLQAVRNGDWKLVLPRQGNPPWTSWYGRMIEAVAEPELYNLADDVSEEHNVAAEHPDVMQRLMTRVATIRKDLGDYDRIGSEVRFFDPGPQRPDMDAWKGRVKPKKAQTRAARPSQKNARRPNVVILLADDLGTLDLHCFGAEDLHTPHLDRLAAGGVRFTQAYAHMVCCPARAALMTGRHPQRGGVNEWTQGNMHAAAGNNMHAAEITLAEVLHDAGYRTGLFGKWHLGARRESGPTHQGFDEFFGFRGGFIDNYNHFFLHQAGYHDLYEGDEEIFAPGKYFPQMVVDRAVGFIEANKDRPFFLYVPFNTPHYPEQPLPQHEKPYTALPQPRRSYASFVTTTDDFAGRVLNKLDELGLTDDTIVVFMSDNGHSVEQNAIDRDGHRSGLPKGHNYGANGGGGYTGKWIGHKATFLEGGIRVPAIIRFPPRVPAGEVRGQAITAMDWYPTVLELCGVNPPDVTLDGRSLLPVIDSPETPSPHEVLHFQWINTWAVRQGDWKLINHQGRGEKSPQHLTLHNLADENPEVKDYAKEKPDDVERLRALREAWAKEVFAGKE